MSGGRGVSWIAGNIGAHEPFRGNLRLADLDAPLGVTGGGDAARSGELELHPANVRARAQAVTGKRQVALSLDFGNVLPHPDAACEGHVVTVAPVVGVHEPGVVPIAEYLQARLDDGQREDDLRVQESHDDAAHG